MPEKDPEKTVCFGTTVKRFKNLGLHPRLTKVNTQTTLGPGQYHQKYPDCAYKKKTGSWDVKLKSEEFSKYLGFRNPQFLCDRVFNRSLGGPGTHDLIDFEFRGQRGPSKLQNVGFGTSARFHSAIKDQTLPPGIHNIKKRTTKFSKTPTFEYDNCQPRFKTVEPSYRQAPTRYNLRPYSICDKVVSKRGPYDTFTGPRDQTTIKNHFAPPSFKPPDTFYHVSSSMDHLLHDYSKRRCGKFLLDERFPEGMSIKTTKKGFTMYVRDEYFPGPAKYNVSEGIKHLKETKHPFNCSNINARPLPDWRIHPGPDRYKVVYPRCHKRKTRGSWMFLSKGERGLPRVESYSNFYF